MDIPARYADLIAWIGDGTGMADSLLHVHAGMAVLFLARILTRKSLATPIPLACVALAEAANEILDRLHYRPCRWAATRRDLDTGQRCCLSASGCELRAADADPAEG